MVKTYSQLYLDVRKQLMASEDAQSAGFITRQLLCHISGKTPEQLVADRELYASEEIDKQLQTAADRYLEGEPLAYLLGEWEFYGLPLYVDKNVLIPRDDTCAVVSLAINHALFLGKDPRVLDLCTGSGCIGLAIASRVKDARVTLADISREAGGCKEEYRLESHDGKGFLYSCRCPEAACGIPGQVRHDCFQPPLHHHGRNADVARQCQRL